jgi:acyl-CoA thioester hydrolase
MSGDAFAGFAIVVRPEWTAAGHLTVASYTLLFDLASDALREEVGLGRDYAEANARSIVVVEAHLTFLREAREADRLRFRTRVLGVAERRLHLFHAMHREDDGSLLATAEMMLVHVDRTLGRSVAFAAPALARLQALERAHAASPRPPRAGRGIAL